LGGETWFTSLALEEIIKNIKNIQPKSSLQLMSIITQSNCLLF